ncbi:DUF1684 domain-containing protein [Pseudonocardia sp. KRD-184]|uniref:DUF1684 domain-containing protein n=1 Tax=Pseudonocardia oceani TaxID=2792013 RepID=A0ABS6UCU7_9PSEU|nr:DUF1684 domain-containing protein [Pseudonocardia oceani]MBW0089930.1 DUF1684 domain-containing protein [Pseudonocardia oceani]MBW0094408.1 DUF1684 domain-containing protein [Pseudonocardia oceani]MBW0107921.1 DUF1684 domain-containing protein [Pseudonocardia oceani]MBW0119985.1 DUF1684 domain-containing protein [Pseudonocardia oceani]MBW0130065.1 DUF1684 domain-containing protein [Pseudonocardia oceani]
MTATLDLHSAWDAWHSDREEQLRTAHGWLSLTALHWLTPEPSTVEGLPGLWSATPDGVVVTASTADGLFVRGVRGPLPVDGTAVLHPVNGLPGSLVEVGDKVVEIARRTDAHVLRVRDPHAPTRTAFTGVPAFDVDPRWVVDGVFEAYDEPRPITVDAVVDGLQHHLTAVGVVRFVVDGAEHSLVAVPGEQGGLSLHFRDATSGVTTYPGGRSVQVPDPVDGRVTIDLNRLVNLPCAFTDFATCPLPPAGNAVSAAVTAGEKSPLR